MWQLFLCVLILALVSILNKHSIGSSNPFSMQLVNALVSVFLIPVWYWMAKKIAPGQIINCSVAPYIILSGILSTICFLLLLAGFKKYPVSIATSILSTYPVITLLAGIYMGWEKFSLTKLVGISLILIGVIITVYYSE